MKVSREKREQHRAAIIGAASRLFRERGPEGVSVAEVMKAAGLTHGGFYGHFDSKEALLAQALSTALEASAEQLRSTCTQGGLGTYVSGYLSDGHLADRGGGCAIAALGSDVARQPDEVRATFADRLRQFMEAVAAGEGDRLAAINTLAHLVGAMVLARAVTGVDDALAEEVLKAARASRGVDAEGAPARSA